MTDPPPDPAAQAAADRVAAALADAENHLTPVVLATIGEFLEAAHAAVLGGPADILPDLDAFPVPDVLVRLLGGLEAATRAVYAAAWDKAMGTLGPQFISDRRPYVDRFVATVPNRLRGVPEQVFDVLRGELTAGLAQAEPVDLIRDRVGRVLGLDAPAAAARARLAGIDHDLATARATGDTTAVARLQGRRAAAVARARKEDGEWQWRARRVARTEATAATNGGEYDANQVRAAATGEPLRKQWLATGDERVRHTHAAANGQVADYAAHFTVGGYPMLYPGDPLAPPGLVVNCRCTLLTLPAGMDPLPVFPIGDPDDNPDIDSRTAAAARGATMPTTAVPAHTPPRPVAHPPVPLPDGELPAMSLRLDPSGGPLVSRGGYRGTVLAAGAPPAAPPAPAPTGPPAPAGGQVPNGWRGVLMPLDTESGDQRVIATPGVLRSRPLPVPLLAQEALATQHDGAVGVGRIDRVWVEDGCLMGEGAFDLADPEGAAWARRLADGFAGGVSVDLDDTVSVERFIDVATGAEMDPEQAVDILFEDPDGEARVRPQLLVTDWRLMSSTMVYQPAFHQAQLQPVYDYQPTPGPALAVDRVDTPPPPTKPAPADVPAGPPAEQEAALLASVGHLPTGPATPPAEWFDPPALGGPTPLTVTGEGRVYGHLALWGTCHTGYGDQVCTTAPRTHTDYALFHTGETLTAEGGRVPVGRITVGTGHADPRAGQHAAAAHYDHTGAAVAVVTAHEDTHGICVAGALDPDATPEQVRALLRSPLSGDWRRVGGNLELVAALAVNSPGFPVPRPRAAATAGRQTSLVAAGMLPPPAPAGAAAGPPMSALLARSLRRGRAEQLAARMALPASPWVATRAALAAMGAGNRALATRVARRHGYPTQGD